MLEVLGAGLSRTGTFSLKRALESLGFAPCYHMDTVFRHPDHVPRWIAATNDQADWRAIFDGYAAALDAPVCHFWRQIRDVYPNTKVILTVRESAEWCESFKATVHETMMDPTRVPAPARPALDMARRVVLDEVFAGCFLDRAHAMAVYETHNRDVIASVDARELLVYRVADGWGPLCEFLSVPVPTQDFPLTNARDQFRSRVGIR